MDILRRCTFHPYPAWMGPRFTLVMYDPHRPRMGTGQYTLGYRFFMDGKLLFSGEDFGCSPMHAIDSDEAVACLLSFLTLKPGDTDSEYFEKYTAEQLDYAKQHAESLWCTVTDRFGEDVCY